MIQSLLILQKIKRAREVNILYIKSKEEDRNVKLSLDNIPPYNVFQSCFQNVIAFFTRINYVRSREKNYNTSYLLNDEKLRLRPSFSRIADKLDS